MDKIPFNLYDFFAYLFSGGAILVVADYVSGTGILWSKDSGAIFIFGLVIFAYVIGHIVAQLSSTILENLLVRRILGNPTLLLMGGNPRNRTLKFLFPLYHRPLPNNVQARVLTGAEARGCVADGEGLFLHAFPIVTANERFQSRLDNFLNQYGFAHNLSLALMISAMAIMIARLFGPYPVKLRWAAIVAAASLCLLYRYLKFFRQYSYELLVRYSELPQS